MSDVIAALGLLLQPATLLMCFVGMLVGLVLGAIPGLAAGLAITVMLPISFTMEPTQAFALLMSIWVGGCSGSFIGSILLGIPGTPSSLATTVEFVSPEESVEILKKCQEAYNEAYALANAQ